MKISIPLILCGIGLFVSTHAFAVSDTLSVSITGRTHLVFPENIRHFDLVGDKWRFDSFENLLMIENQSKQENFASVIVKAGEETHFFYIKTTTEPVALAQTVDAPLKGSKSRGKEEQMPTEAMPFMSQLLMQYRMDVVRANLMGKFQHCNFGVLHEQKRGTGNSNRMAQNRVLGRAC